MSEELAGAGEAPVATAAETQNVATEAENVPEPAQEATEDAGEHADSADATEKPKDTETAEQEAKRLRRDNRKRERTQQRLYGENEVLKAELARLQTQASPEAGEQASNASDPVGVARQIIAQERFEASVADTIERGIKEFKQEFNETTNAVNAEIPLREKNGSPTPFMLSLMDTDDPAALIHHIGSDPDLIDELADLSGRKLDRRIALIEAELKAKPPQVSKAPSPITPLKPQSIAGEPDTRDTKAWNDWFDKRRAASGRG